MVLDGEDRGLRDGARINAYGTIINDDTNKVQTATANHNRLLPTWRMAACVVCTAATLTGIALLIYFNPANLSFHSNGDDDAAYPPYDPIGPGR